MRSPTQKEWQRAKDMAGFARAQTNPDARSRMVHAMLYYAGRKRGLEFYGEQIEVKCG